jgi:hypothetical protein
MRPKEAPDPAMARRSSGPFAGRLLSEQLGRWLWKVGTRLAVFSACNSARWAFMRPLIDAGLPPLIGMQGLVSTTGSAAFCQKLYASLAIGPSLDEAIIGAHLHLFETLDAPGPESCEWGTFTVYLPTTEAVLLPRPHDRTVRERQRTARHERQQTIIHVRQLISSVHGGQVTGSSGVGAGKVGALGQAERAEEGTQRTEQVETNVCHMAINDARPQS